MCLILKLIGVGALDWRRSRQSQVMEPLVLYPNLYVQLKVFVPNLLVTAVKVNMGVETALDTQLRLLLSLLLHSLRLSCKAWKTIVDKSVEYNDLRLAPNSMNIFSANQIFCV